MSLKTQYEIAITRSGNGAAVAATELKAVQAAATSANAALASTTAGAKAHAEAQGISESSVKNTSAAFKALRPVLELVGLQSFPQLTAAGHLTREAMVGLRESGVALQANMLTVGTGIAGLTALIIAAGFAWSAYKAKEEEAMTAKAVEEQTKEFAETLNARLLALRNSGQITVQTFEQLNRVAGTLAGNTQLRDFLKNQGRSNPAEEIGDLERLIALENSRNLLSQYYAQRRLELGGQSLTMAQREELVKKAQSKSDQDANDILTLRLNLYQRLFKEGVITQQDLDKLSDEAQIKLAESTSRTTIALEDLHGKLTDLQQLGRAVGETFASQLSGALVASFKEGGKALQQFASQFFATVAQMIMQALIMRALFGATGASTGTGGLIGGLINKAAVGGFFPEMMAAGGMAGIATVSSATYFPRHNVVAGEAGTEIMTVLARPRFMQVGGMQAMVGMAGGNKLAITDADQLAAHGGGVGGHIVVDVNLSRDMEGRIVENSVKNSVARVTHDMSIDSKLSRTIKQLR